jgi:hypothetical protein
VIRPSQRPIPTQGNTTQTKANIHALSGIVTHDLRSTAWYCEQNTFRKLLLYFSPFHLRNETLPVSETLFSFQNIRRWTKSRNLVIVIAKYLDQNWFHTLRLFLLNFFFSPCVHTSFEAHPASYPVATGASFPRGKARPGRDADHSPPSSAEVENE